VCSSVTMVWEQDFDTKLKHARNEERRERVNLTSLLPWIVSKEK
jgi:hypothetical protein